MRGLIRKIFGLSLLGILLAMPVIVAQQRGGRKGGSKSGGGRKAGKPGKKAPSKGGRGGN